MKRDNWIVGADSIRPAGNYDECFYCNAKFGIAHKQGCVIRTRTVVVKVSFEMIREIPEDWSEDMIEFHMNESSSCKDNLIEAISKQSERLGCSCSFGIGEFLREATEEDETTFLLKSGEG